MEKRCAEVESLANILFEQGTTIPEKSVAHARVCTECSFWLSYLLALHDAHTITRRFQSNGECPPIEDFKLLLLGSIRTIWTYGSTTIANIKHTAQNLTSLTLEYLPAAAELWDHLYACNLCHFYYDTLYEAMTQAQPTYFEMIRTDNTISIAYASPPSEVTPEKIIEVLSFDEQEPS